MLYPQISHGAVLTDAIVYVSVHTCWTGRLHVDYYARHRADTMPTVIQCSADNCCLAVDAVPLYVLLGMLTRPLTRIEGGSGLGAGVAEDGVA
jgi:hypothetical protein